MSYILEALKKAQAERQLGETPGIHTPTLDAPAGAGAPLRKPLVAAVAVMGVVIVGLAAVVWRQAAAPAQPVQPAAVDNAPAQAVPPPAAAAVPAPAPQPSSAVPPDTAARPAQPPQPVQQAAPAPEPAPGAAQVTQPAASAPPAVAKAPEPPARAAAATAEAPASGKSEGAGGDEPVQALRDLPEPIRRAVPPVTMSGYMYSPNPADRLILIDRVLRREGDEVAPGLVLERLEPKGAVFAFRGYRFRMPY